MEYTYSISCGGFQHDRVGRIEAMDTWSAFYKIRAQDMPLRINKAVIKVAWVFCDTTKNDFAIGKSVWRYIEPSSKEGFELWDKDGIQVLVERR